MSKLELDLKKLGSLGEEIKIKERRLDEIEKSAEKIRNEIIKEKREADKVLAKEQEDFDVYKRGIEQAHKDIEKGLTKREKDFQIMKQGQKDIEKDIQRLNAIKKSIAGERKEVDFLMSTALDREHKATLIIKQYEKKIEELSGSPSETEIKEKPKKKR